MSRDANADIQIGTTESDPSVSIEVLANGPYRVRGTRPLHVQEIVQNEAGQSWSYRDGQTFPIKDGTTLCRCGASSNKLFCDGSHASIKFQDDLVS